MTPVTFASCFGWYHEAAGSCGLILCAPQGHEDLCTHKQMRLMADTFAAHGYPALRFDYAGTGDSLGSDYDPQRLEAWVASIEAAVDWLRVNANVDTIVLLGLRLGSALASLAASRLGTISGLILLAPTVSGRAYMRELLTLSKIIRKPDGMDEPSQPANQEIAGFVFTPETAKDIGAIDLTAFKSAPVPQALIIAIESQASADRLAKSWRLLGCEVDQKPFLHYAEFVMDPAFSRFPKEVLDHSLDWLAARFFTKPNKTQTPIPPYKPHDDAHFSEMPVFFGGDDTLFGLLCVPKDLSRERPVAVYLNAGANHHIGWGRSTVEVCRKMAASGIATLRIDIAAIGDSPDDVPGLDQILYRDESTLDVSAAIDWLNAQGFRNITVIGLCAGAHLGFHTAVQDPRVTRVIMVNIQKFIWHKHDSLIVAYHESYQSMGFYVRRAFKAETWRKLVTGNVKVRGIMLSLFQRVRKKLIASASSILHRFESSTANEIATVKGWMMELDRRGVEQSYIFSIGDAGLDELSLYRRIRGGVAKKAPHVSIAFIENADHNLSEHAGRERLVEILQDILCVEETGEPEGHSHAHTKTFALPELS